MQNKLMCVNNSKKVYLSSCTLESGFVHGGHTRAVVLSWKTVDVNLQRDGSNRRPEVKQTHLLHKRESEEKEKGTKTKRFNVSSWQRAAHLSERCTVCHCHRGTEAAAGRALTSEVCSV